MIVFRDGMLRYVMRIKGTKQWRRHTLRTQAHGSVQKSLISLGNHVTCCGIRYLRYLDMRLRTGFHDER
jgi:hypothetical protein